RPGSSWVVAEVPSIKLSRYATPQATCVREPPGCGLATSALAHLRPQPGHRQVVDHADEISATSASRGLGEGRAPLETSVRGLAAARRRTPQTRRGRQDRKSVV